MIEEIWKPVADVLYGKNYEVSNLGRIRRVRNHIQAVRHGYPIYKVLKQHKHKDHGTYPHVTLSYKSMLKTFPVHILVARAFIGPPPPNMVVSHKDDNPEHSHLDNLEYKTQRDNLYNSKKWRPENLWLRVSVPRKQS